MKTKDEKILDLVERSAALIRSDLKHNGKYLDEQDIAIVMNALHGFAKMVLQSAKVDDVMTTLRAISDPVAMSCLDEYDPKLSRQIRRILKEATR